MIDPAAPNYTSSQPGINPDARRPAAALPSNFPDADDPAPRSPGRAESRHPAISIVTAYFNPGDVFEQTCRSVLAQTLENWEWIVVDDCSTDPRSREILDQLPRRDPRVRVVRLASNSGPSAARNRGFEEARAELIFQLDADDLIEPTALEKFAWFLSVRPDVHFAASYEVGFGAQEYLWTLGFHTPEIFLKECPVGAHAVAVRKSAWRAAGGYDERIRGGMEDWDFWLRAASVGLWGATIPEYLTWYRRRDHHGARWADWDGGERQRQFLERLKLKYPGVFASPPVVPQMHDGVYEPLPAMPSAFAEHARLRSPRERHATAQSATTSRPTMRHALTGSAVDSRVDSPESRPEASPWNDSAIGEPDHSEFQRELESIVPDAAGRQRRLLLIVPWLTMGGADKFNLSLVDRLRRRGWEITIATTLRGEHAWAHQFARQTPDVFVTQHFLRSIDVPLFLRYLVESRRPDAVLVTQSELGYWLLPYLQAHCPEPAYIDYIHMEESYWNNGGYPRYAAKNHALLDMTVASSHHLRRWVIDRGGDPAKTEVCTTNEDTDAWRPDPEIRDRVRQELGIAPDVGVLVYAGRICAQKQPRVLAGALRELARRDTPFVALIAGNGEDRPILDTQLADLIARGDVRMLGAVSNARIKELFAAADIFFLPSLWEGISLAVYEAMAAGLAIVGADVGGQIELVTPETGRLITRSDEPAEAAQYADILDELLRDSDARAAMGRAARERIERHYRLDDMGHRMETLLLRSIERAADAAPRRVIPAQAADELAARAVEHFRVHAVADYLWNENIRLRETLAAISHTPAPHVAATIHPVAAANGSFAMHELKSIEGSLAWRAVERFKRTAIYDGLARARWGSGWRDGIPSPEEPETRLAIIKSSRSYRFIAAVKNSAIYRVYASLKGSRGA